MNYVNSLNFNSLQKIKMFFSVFVMTIIIFIGNNTVVSAVTYNATSPALVGDSPYVMYDYSATTTYCLYPIGDTKFYFETPDPALGKDGNGMYSTGSFMKYRWDTNKWDAGELKTGKSSDGLKWLQQTDRAHLINCRGDVPIYENDRFITKWYSPPIPSPLIFKFLQPSSNFVDTTDGYNFTVYYDLPENTDPQYVDIKVHSDSIPNANWSITSHDYTKATGEGILKVFASDVSVGTHIVYAELNNSEIEITIQRLAGSVDEDGDGIDDRTNQPVDDGHANYDDLDGKGITKGIETLSGFLGTMTTFSGKIFAFFPSEVRIIMVFVISVMGFIAVKKMIF